MLFKSKIDPRSRTKDLSYDEILLICDNLYKIFKRSVDLGGSSISDYTGGRYQNELKVYGRNKEPCFECSTDIKRITQAGRATFYCPTCQEEEENEIF